MSAVISYRGSDEVIILTDGAVYDEDHRLLTVERKVTISDKAPLAIASRGNKPCTDLLERKIIEACERWGVDDGLDAIRDSLPQWAEMLPKNDFKFKAQLLIAGFSESLGAQHWFMQTEDGPDLPAFELHDVTGSIYYGINGPAANCIADGRIRRPWPGEAPFDYFRTVGVDIMQLAREQKTTSRWWPGSAHLVGGQIDMTVISARGSQVATIHRWDDKVGEKINPFSGFRKVLQ